MMTFSQLKAGEKARILSMRAVAPAYRQRLQALGLREGVVFELLQRAPFGDALVIGYQGSCVCVRGLEADAIDIVGAA
jgi:Fe2+ transport system protein FeoA